MKLALAACSVAAFLLDSALALSITTDAVAPHHEALRSDAKLRLDRFMRRRIEASIVTHPKEKKETPDDAPSQDVVVDVPGPSEQDATKEQTVRNIMIGAKKVQKNPINDIGKAMENADEAAADHMSDTFQGGSSDGENDKDEAPTRAESEGTEDKETPSVPGCKDSPHSWADKRGQDCEDYAQGEWCTRYGGYGDGWLDEWPKFEELAMHGKTAPQVCCVCGGGVRSGDSEWAGGPAPSAYVAAAPTPAITRPLHGLQEQGFMGDLVEHEDESTMTEDWGKEFGPASGHRDFAKICHDHKDNEWCLMHGYYEDKSSKSYAAPERMLAVIAIAVLMCLR